MRKFQHPRLMKVDPKYVRCEQMEGDEIWRNGVMHFNVSRIIDDIESGKLSVIQEKIDVKKWNRTHSPGVINEEHMPNVVFSKPIIQAEIRHDMFVLIDGNHRMEKAKREGLEFIDSYKLSGEQLSHYLTSVERYQTYVRYWNSKLEEHP